MIDPHCDVSGSTNIDYLFYMCRISPKYHRPQYNPCLKLTRRVKYLEIFVLLYNMIPVLTWASILQFEII